MRRQIMWAILLLIAVGLACQSAAAQVRVSDYQHQSRNDAAEFTLMAQRQMPSAYGAGFRWMPASNRTAIATSSVFPITPIAAAANLPVLGSGTIGRLTKWTGFTSGNSVIGNSTIFEDKNGLVGIGTDTPTSRLTVAGTIHSLSGGVKFPDGSVQTTSATGTLFSVTHDATLAGDGTTGSPLRVAVPLSLSGSTPSSILTLINSPGSGGDGLRAIGGTSGAAPGGKGVRAFGGATSSGKGGEGIFAGGGNSSSGDGGEGVIAEGGAGGSQGGHGLTATGGQGSSGGGSGLRAMGGATLSVLSGGAGVFAEGGDSTLGAGGPGIVALGGQGPLSAGVAGRFLGGMEINGNTIVGEDLFVVGMLSKGGGSFKIDHPLDPENRYLSHSFVESPDMMNIYNGNITTDENGEAVVTLPYYFEALNQDFRYQLTVVGTFAQAMVAKKVKNNHFVIRTSAPGVEVSWQVTGIRQDAWANKNRIQVEVEKTERERGYYLHPEAFNQPEELSIDWLHHSELMKQRKAARQQAKAKKP